MVGIELLKRAEEAGLTVTCVGDSLRIRGPKSAEAIVQELSANKSEVIAAIKDGTLTPAPASELRARLRKGIEWFLAVDPKLWDENDYPVYDHRKLEIKMMEQTLKWLELERLLRNLYEYEGCIFDGRTCPVESPVRCTACG